MDIKVFRIFLVILLGASLLACGGAEERKAKYLERGKAYFEEENFDKARVEFKNVLQIDPKTAEPWYYLGKIEESNREWAKAFGDYSKAIELNPELIRPRARLAQFYLLQANAEKINGNSKGEQTAIARAAAELEEVLRRAPADAEALTIQASIMKRNGDTAGAVSQLGQILSNNPDHAPAVVLLGALKEQQKDIEGAISVFEAGVAAKPDDVGLKLALARFYSRHEQQDASVAVLREVIALEPEEYGYRLTLAQYLMQLKRPDDAEQVLREAIAADPEDAKRYIALAEFLSAQKGSDAAVNDLKRSIKSNPELTDLRFALAGLYQKEGDIDASIAELQRVVEDQGTEPEGLRARNRLAQIYASLSDFDNTRVLTEEVLEENPKDNDALIMQGRLALKDSDFPEAVAAFRSVLKDQPGNVTVLTYLAEAHLRNGETELAGEALRRAVDAEPDNAEARIRLARYFLQAKDNDGALEQVDVVLGKTPDHVTALILKTDILGTKGDKEGVRPVIDTLKATEEGRIEGHLRSARLYLLDKDARAALEDVDVVLAEQPENLQALVIKSDALAALGDETTLEPVLAKIKEIAPEQSGSYFRMGRFHRAQQETDKAIVEYEKGLAESADPQAKAQLLTEIVNTELSAGRTDAATARLNTALEEDSANPVAHVLLGSIYMREKRYPEAEIEFEKQLEISPKNAVVYTQLAAARMAQDDLDGAVLAYEQGLAAVPDDPRLLLGLAGVYERQRNIDKALETYERLLVQNPDNLIAVNNVAALLADHRTDEASLNRAKELSAKLAQAEQPALRDTVGWVSYRTGDYENAVSVLRGVVNDAPQIPVFQYHLGMALFKQGDKDQAKVHLSKAIELGEFQGIEEARSTLESLN